MSFTWGRHTFDDLASRDVACIHDWASANNTRDSSEVAQYLLDTGPDLWQDFASSGWDDMDEHRFDAAVRHLTQRGIA